LTHPAAGALSPLAWLWSQGAGDPGGVGSREKPADAQTAGCCVARAWDYEQRYPCPCGNGEYAHRSTDKSEHWVMLCPECEPHYVYDRRPTQLGLFRPWKGESPRRGWVRTEVVREEERYHQALLDFQRAVIQKVDDLCRATWRTQLVACKTKKAVWELTEMRQAEAYRAYS